MLLIDSCLFAKVHVGKYVVIIMCAQGKKSNNIVSSEKVSNSIGNV